MFELQIHHGTFEVDIKFRNPFVLSFAFSDIQNAMHVLYYFSKNLSKYRLATHQLAEIFRINYYRNLQHVYPRTRKSQRVCWGPKFLSLFELDYFNFPSFINLAFDI